MDKAWVEKKTKDHMEKIAHMKADIVAKITACELIPESKKRWVLSVVDEYEKEPYITAHGMSIVLMKAMTDVDVEIEWFDDFIYKTLKLEDFIMAHRYKYFGHLLDSELVEFDGDIIITDPCYLIKERDESTAPKMETFQRDYSTMTQAQYKKAYREDMKEYRKAFDVWAKTHPDDWETCEYGYNMAAIGMPHAMCRSTLYGDWGCTTYNSDTKEVLGHFTADAGEVGAFTLDEVLNYNPEYDDHINNTYCVTLIKDFKGTVQFTVEEESPDHGDYIVRVVGKGVNKKTGLPLNFITSQTSL